MTTNRQKKGPPKRQRPPEGGFLWNALACISFVSAILIFIGLGLHSWRATDTVTFHYIQRGLMSRDTFSSSQYGLYMVSFNGGSVIKPWHTLMSQICTGIDAFAPIGGALDLLGLQNCGNTCVGHYRTRCNVYNRLLFWGYLTLGVLIVTGSLALVASAWILLFGVSRVIIQLLWTCSSSLALAVMAFWTMESNNLFTSLGVDSQFPYPSVSTAYYLALSGCLAIVFCGLIALLTAYFHDRAETLARQREIDERILAATNANSPFGGGLMIGMPGAAGGFAGAQAPPRGYGAINRPPPPGMWAPPAGAPPLPPRAMQLTKPGEGPMMHGRPGF